MAMSKDTITGAFYSKPGHNVELSEGNTVAIVGGAYRFYNNKITMRRVVFSREPIEIKETFQVHVVRRQYGINRGFGDCLFDNDSNLRKGLFVRTCSEPQQNMVREFYGGVAWAFDFTKVVVQYLIQ